MTSIHERLHWALLHDQSQLVEELKELKNSVIGNVLRKVQVAEDADTLQFLVGLLKWSQRDFVYLHVVNEVAIILGSLANVGNLTLEPLLLVQLPQHLMALISSCAVSDELPKEASFTHFKLLPSLLRALRNIMCSAADAVWGHMWGVGVERRVVNTGLSAHGIVKSSSKGKAKANVEEWRAEAKSALSLVFETANLNCLLSLLTEEEDMRANQQVSLPLFQMLAHLVALPTHRRTVAGWSHTSSDSVSNFINQLLLTISQPSCGLRSSAAAGNKLQVAALDLLASLTKDEPHVVTIIKKWQSADGIYRLLWQVIKWTEPGVRVAAAACLTNMLSNPAFNSGTTAGSDHIVQIAESDSRKAQADLVKIMPSLLVEPAVEDRIRACFVLASLVKDRNDLQEVAARVQCPDTLISKVTALHKGFEDTDISSELRARYMESLMLALSALAFHHEPSRALIANAQPSILDIMLDQLSHESYGVRAATCQLARALSRSVAILRTNLMDSGVGNGVLDVLKRETERKPAVRDERAWTVEVAAAATLCNLVTDFSPMQTSLIETGGIELLASLTKSEHEPLQLNALWALKNMTYHAPESVKAKVMEALGWDELAILLDVATSLPLREQAIDIVRNLVADAAPTEIGRVAECIGYDYLLESLEMAIQPNFSLQAPAFWVLSNLALGPEKLRIAITSRIALVEGMSNAVNDKADKVKIPALMCLCHLIEMHGKPNRPRPSMVALFQPYQLAARLHELAFHSPSLDVAQAATSLLSLIRTT